MNYQIFFLRNTMTLYFKDDNAELQALINITIGLAREIAIFGIYYAKKYLA